MRFVLLDRAQTVLAYCDAQTKLGAIAKLKPKEGETVTSEASFRIGFSREVARRIREDGEWCSYCKQPVLPKDRRPNVTGHTWCAERKRLENRNRRA